MEITNKKLAAGVVTILLLGFATGRWTSPSSIKTDKEQLSIDTTTKKQDNKTTTDTDRDKKLKTTITETTNPDGTKTKTTEITEDTSTKRITKVDDKQSQTDTKVDDKHESKEVEYKKPDLAVRGMVGTDVSSLSSGLRPIFGGEVNKNIIGPVSGGVWGLSNRTCGVSVGLQF